LYNVRTSGKLKLKGEKKKSKKDKKSKKRKLEESAVDEKRAKFVEDRTEHAGWWKSEQFSEITGPVIIEIGKLCYVKALDDGSFALGAKHSDKEGPDPEEVLVAIKVNESKVAFKSGFNKYLRVDKDGKLRGISDAVGAMEQFEPIFQDGKLALLAANSMFMTVNEDDDTIVCDKQKAGKSEMLKIRSNAEREEDKDVFIPVEERGNVGQIEMNFVKKFQKFQGGSLRGVDHKLKINNEDRTEIVKAKREGYMHEALLDRRSKMKADRYCK